MFRLVFSTLSNDGSREGEIILYSIKIVQVLTSYKDSVFPVFQVFIEFFSSGQKISFFLRTYCLCCLEYFFYFHAVVVQNMSLASSSFTELLKDPFISLKKEEVDITVHYMKGRN